MTILPPTKISSKIANSFVTGAIVTLAVEFVSSTPLTENPWLAWLKNPATTNALVVILATIAGYQTEEKQY